MRNNTTPESGSDVLTRDGILPSLWQQAARGSSIPLNASGAGADRTWDALIVGGGITGLTTALLLQEAGLACAIAEAHFVGFGTTGGTTAHINTMLDTPYHTIESNFGTSGAEIVANAARAARDLIARNVSHYQIACDFEYKEGILFAQTEKEAAELEKIYSASQRAGVDVDRTSHVPVPLEFQTAIAYHKQAQMHPLRYVYALADRFFRNGGVIFEHTRVMGSTRKGDLHQIETTDQPLKSRRIVYATHIPPGLNMLHLRCAPYRSYVLAVQLADGKYPTDLAYDMQEPYHYFRTHVVNDTPYLIIGGEDHKTGHGSPTRAFQSLEAYARTHFQLSSVDFRWSAQYFEPTDGLPYIGTLPGADEDTYVATGFSGNGILFGSFSGLLLADLILGRENPGEKLFSPSRIKPVAGFTNFVKENADVAYRFVSDRFGTEQLEALVELAPGTGAVVNYEQEKIALYKSPNGKVSALSPVCTHAGCIVAWNDAEKTWDCPCHGGRYDVYGNVLTGPPRKNLQTIPIS
jgi:Glycine/D-amino acid oxidases (deaminating)